MQPDKSTPMAMATKAFLTLISNKDAATQPVHAPVIGNGIATNKMSPIAPYLRTSSALFSVRLNIYSKNLRQIFHFLKTRQTGSKNISKGSTGIKLPMTASTKVFSTGWFIERATGIVPLNSFIGNIELKTISNSLFICSIPVFLLKAQKRNYRYQS